MAKISRRSVLKTSALTAAAASLPAMSEAQQTTYTAADLGGALTPFGGLKAGNAEGTIPAWDGGYTTVPAGYVSGDPRPDPFADEKPLFSITGQNYTQYQDKLQQGIIALLTKYPDFRVDVYTTHRTAAAPQYVYDYIKKNATSAQLSADGTAVTGAYGGIPFPIPTNGFEVIWNHELAWGGATYQFSSDAHTVTPEGNLVFETRVNAFFQYPYYFPNGESTYSGFYLQEFITPVAPPYEAGGTILLWQSENPILEPNEGWTYLIGQRRVRRAPELQYDTPNSLSGGITNWDEAHVFSGKLDRYDCKLLGTKEMFVPYNCNKAYLATPEEQHGPHFLNPDLIRWELHRVRVVEMTLRPGARNVDARRLMYCDEDAGSALACDIFDASGALSKYIYITPAVFPDFPCHFAGTFFTTYDLHSGSYTSNSGVSIVNTPQFKLIPELPSSFFTAGQVAASEGGL